MSPLIVRIRVIEAERCRGIAETALIRLMNKPKREQQSSDKAVATGRLLLYRQY